METKTVLTPLQKKIEKLKAESQAKLNEEIEKLTKEDKSKEARKVLENKIKDEKEKLEIKHKEYIKSFEFEYSVAYDLLQPKPLTIEEKCKIARQETNEDGSLKYKLSEDLDIIIGSKGQPINSIISFYRDEVAKKNKDKKETLSVKSYLTYMLKNK